MVKKKDGSWQQYRDYRQLNLQTLEDKYPLPNMVDLAGPTGWLHHLQQAESKEGIPAGTGRRRRHCQNSYYHAIWEIRVPSYAFQPT
jgi:hypothetical protein